MKTNETKVICVRSIIGYLWEKRIRILLISLIVSLLAGGLYCLHGLKKWQTDTEAMNFELEDYYARMDAYREEQAYYTRKIEYYENKIQTVEQANETDAIVMTLDADHLLQTRAVLQLEYDDLKLDSESKLSEEVYSLLLDTYVQELEDQLNWKKLRKIANLKKNKYVKSLISFSTDLQEHLVMIRVSYPSADIAGEMMDLILKTGNEITRQLQTQTGAFHTELLLRQCGYTSDSMIAEKQASRLQWVENLQTLQKSYQEKLDQMEEPTWSEYIPSRKTVAIKAVILTVILFLTIVILQLVWYYLKMIWGDWFYSEDDFYASFAIPVVGVIPVISSPKDQSFSASDNYRQVIDTIKTLTKDSRKILLIGIRPDFQIEDFVKTLSDVCTECKSRTVYFSEDQDTLTQAILEAEECFFLVKRKESSFYQIEKVIQLLGMYSKQIKGAVVF